MNTFTTLTTEKKLAVKDVVADVLKTSIPVTVLFQKENGDLRTMVCTLNEDYINYEYKTSNRNYSSDHIAVYDMKEQAYRAFRFDRVIRVGKMTMEEIISHV